MAEKFNNQYVAEKAIAQRLIAKPMSGLSTFEDDKPYMELVLYASQENQRKAELVLYSGITSGDACGKGMHDKELLKMTIPDAVAHALKVYADLEKSVDVMVKDHERIKAKEALAKATAKATEPAMQNPTEADIAAKDAQGKATCRGKKDTKEAVA